mmetsp:Transcript_79046/g.177082  ORF Transcript_79046/g.177082 Transcript_79046/m.177082 type:complete len:216 (+) Transcript_79046:155-802(+)
MRGSASSDRNCPADVLIQLGVPREQILRAHVVYPSNAIVLFVIAIAKVLTEELEVSRIDLLHHLLCLGGQVPSPDVVATVHVKDVLALDSLTITVISEELVHRLREAPVVDRQGNAVGPIEIFGLGEECARTPKRVFAFDGRVHHFLESSIHIACFKELRVGGPIACYASTEHGDEPLVGIPEQAEDLFVPKLFLQKVLWPVLLGREVKTASSDR